MNQSRQRFFDASHTLNQRIVHGDCSCAAFAAGAEPVIVRPHLSIERIGPIGSSRFGQYDV